MSDDIASQVARLNSIIERLPQLSEHVLLLKQSHDGLRTEISDIAGNSSFTRDVRGDIQFADKMIDDYVSWMRQLTEKLSQFSQRVQQAGMGGGPFG